MVSPTRAEFEGSLTAADVNELVKQPALQVLQSARPTPEAVWTLLNERFFAVRPDVELRVYGHYSNECDLAIARRMTNVRRFAADCLTHGKDVEALGEIRGLESLSLGIFDLEGFGVLERVPSTLQELRLGPTKSRKPSLAPVGRLRSLRVLHLEGQGKDIAVLRQLHDLEELTLRSITTGDLTFLAGLQKLRSLDIKLGGIRTFRGVERKRSIQHLALCQVRGLRGVDVVGVLPGLQNLFLQSLSHVESLPSLRASDALRRVVVQNMKGLHDFSALGNAPALEEFALVEGHKQTPQQLLPVLKNPAVRRVSAGFGSERKNREFSRLREEHGKSEWTDWEPFAYR